MFDPRDLASDPRTRPAAPPRRDLTKEREQRQRSGHRREYDPRSKRRSFQERMDRAVADIGVYRSVATRDLAEAHFEGHPFAARRTRAGAHRPCPARRCLQGAYAHRTRRGESGARGA